ncbi:MAG: RmlD substrate binding domain, partial [Actinomycetota bacterium]
MTDMKILITGASGLIGQALTKELVARGHSTVAA